MKRAEPVNTKYMKAFLSFCAWAVLPGPASAQWVQVNASGNSTVLCFTAADTTLVAGTYSGAEKSTDSGRTWAPANTGFNSSPRVVSLTAFGSMIFAGTDDGIFISKDHAANWAPTDSGLLPNTIVFSLAVSGNKVFAGTAYHGVYASSDSGASWAAADTGFPPSTSVYSLAVSGGKIFAGSRSAGVFLSSDDGATWSAMNSGLPANAVANYVYSLQAKAGSVFAAIGNTVYSSPDDGTTWAATVSGLMLSDVYSLAMNGTDLFAATYNDGVFRSTDHGLSWTAFSTGLQTNNHGGWLMAHAAYLFYGSGSFGIWRRPLSDAASVWDMRLGSRRPFFTRSSKPEFLFGARFFLVNGRPD